MLNNKPFYHRVFRKAIVAFGALFSDIKIERADKTGTVIQTLDVPIAQAPKEKWIVRIDADPNLDQHTYITLPRMSFEITGIAYDPSRKINRLNRVMCPGNNNGDSKYAWAPVPYNIDISLYILTKTQEDAFQIVEQILPFFTPDFTIGIRSVEDMNIVHDIPIILNSISQQDDYDGDFQTRRFITYTLTFTMKLNLYGPINNAGLITKTIVDIGDINNSLIDPDQSALITVTGDMSDGVIREQYD